MMKSSSPSHFLTYSLIYLRFLAMCVYMYMVWSGLTHVQFQYQLKGISFLPKMELGAYAQMPYEEITEAKYKEVGR